MTRTTARALTLAAGLAAAAAPTAHAQPCQPTWDPAIGVPGVSSGYVAPMTPWNDGSGVKLFAGGSFASIGGVPGTSRVAAWNPATSAWISLAGGVDNFVTSILPFNPGSGEILVVGGNFGVAGATPDTRAIAAWNGTTWVSLGAGLTSGLNAIWTLNTYNAQLIAAGSFQGIGTAFSANGIAAWNGTTWSPLGSFGITGAFDPVIFASAVFDEDGPGPNPPALFVGGRFDAIDGVAGTGRIARWNGTAWSSVGGGLAASVTGGIQTMAVFNDGSGPALYVGGNSLTAAGQPAANVVKWNGSAWTAVGGLIGTRATALAVYDDGSGPALYLGGSGTPSVGYLARLVAGQWQTYLGGVQPTAAAPSPSVFGLTAYNGNLYVGGSFRAVGPAALPASGIARVIGCPPPPACYANCDGSTSIPALNALDFSCFLTRYRAGDPYANCDASTNLPTLNALDFGCFLTRYQQGCP